MKILVLNAGSSSFKLAIYEFIHTLPQVAQEPLWSAELNWQPSQTATLQAHLLNANSLEKSLSLKNPIEGMQQLLDTALKGPTKCLNSLTEIDIIGHRIVHGGKLFQQPTLITHSVKETIRQLCSLAPLHNPYNLQGIELIEKLLPSKPQVAVFDTAFHHSIPIAANTYAGPFEWREQGIQRYGFHGISHKYCTERCATLLKRQINTLNIVSCHLGNGCSLAAVQHGKCIDTTMGFTPLDGLMMGTRCGAVDPGILLYLQQEEKKSCAELVHTLNYESGLIGISGTTNDMREIIKLCAQDNLRAKLAYEMFIHSLKKNIGAMIAVLGGLDVILFTAGIGENAASVRSDACAAFQYMGLAIDEKKNVHSEQDYIISEDNSRIKIVVIHTKEDWSIACACYELFVETN